MRRSWQGGLVLGLIMAFWSHPGMSAKIERYTDSEGTVHITNAGEAEPGKPGTPAPPTPIGTLPPQQIFPSGPPPPRPGTVKPPPPPPPAPPKMVLSDGESSAGPPAAVPGVAAPTE